MATAAKTDHWAGSCHRATLLRFNLQALSVRPSNTGRGAVAKFLQARVAIDRDRPDPVVQGDWKSPGRHLLQALARGNRDRTIRRVAQWIDLRYKCAGAWDRMHL